MKKSPGKSMIRLATFHDLDQLTLLFDLYRQFYEQSSDLLGARTFLQERMENRESVILIAETDKLVGFAQLYPTFTSVGMRPVWVLNDLFVKQEFRGLGFGEELIKAATDFSYKTGARNLTLQTAVTNIGAQKLYEKLGWKKNDKFYTYSFFH